MTRTIKKNKKMSTIGNTFTNTYIAAIAGLNEEEATEKLLEMMSEQSSDFKMKMKLATGRLTKKVRQQKLQHTEPIPGISNQYKILDNMENETGSENGMLTDREEEEEHFTQNIKNNISNHVSNKNDENTTTRKSKLPPIVVYNANIRNIINDLKIKLKHDKFNIKSLNKNCTHINTQNIEDFDMVTEYIKNKKLNHYTYTPVERKTINLLIKGINNSYTSQEIVDEIDNFNLDNVQIIKCTPFKTKYNPNSNVFLLTLTNNSDTKQLVKIKYLLHQKIYFENIKKSEGISMCHRCQKIGHSAANCSMEPRCVKCSEKHLTIDCNNIKTIKETKVDPVTGEIVTNTITIPKCVNCGQEGHPANYSKCPSRLAYIHNLREKREINQRITQNRKKFIQKSINNYVQPSISYAQQLHNPQINYNKEQTNTTYNNINSTNFEYFENECNEKLGDNLFNIIGKVNDFVAHYKNLPDNNKKVALLTFIMSLC